MRRTTIVAVYVLLVAFGLVPTVGYFVIERVTNAEAPVDVPAGNWVTAVWVEDGIHVGRPVACTPVCELGDNSGYDTKAWLIAEHAAPGGRHNFIPRFENPPQQTSRPADVAYTVSVCGHGGGTVRGMFLIGPGVRMGDVRVPAATWTPAPLPEQAAISSAVDPRSRVTDTIGGLEQLQQPFSLAGARAVPFEFPKEECPAQDLTKGEEVPYSFQSATIVGSTRHSGTTEFTVGPLVGAHQRRDWPTLGIRGLEVGDLGTTFPPGTRADSQGVVTYRLETGGLEPNQVTDSVSPTPVDVDHLVFESTNAPITASARVTDLGTLEHWRSVLTGMGILVGIAGGIFATLVITGLLSVAERQKRAATGAAGGGDPGRQDDDPAVVAARLRELADRLDPGDRPPLGGGA